MKRLVLALPLLTILASCQQESPDPVTPPQEAKAEAYTVKYQFINEGDANLQSVVLWTRTTFPKGNEISLFDQAFNSVSAQDTLVKAVEGPYANLAYAGCTTRMFIRVAFKEPVYSRYPRSEYYGEGKNIQRHYEIALNTIQKAEDALVSFRWPSDTLKLQEVPYHNINQ